MTNIKTYKDGSRLILVLENCTGETAAKVNKFILDVMGMPTEPITVPEIIPEKVEEEPVPDVSRTEEVVSTAEKPFDEPLPEESVKNIAVNGASGTLGRAIENGDTAAIVELCLRAKHMEDSMRYTALGMCKAYIKADCAKREPDLTSSKEIQKFFRVYEPLISGAIKQVLEKSGFATEKEFFQFTEEYIQQDAYRSILDALLQRVS